MRYILLVSSKRLELEALQAAAPSLSIAQHIDTGDFDLGNEGDPNHIWINELGDSLADWEEDDPNSHLRLSALGSHIVYAVNYRSVPSLVSALTQIANSPEAMIDDDYGLLMAGDEFAARVLAQPDVASWFLVQR